MTPFRLRKMTVVLAAIVAWCAPPDALAARGARPGYAESSALAGGTLAERLATAGQLDRLEDTSADSVRACAAVTLDAYLLLGGEFAAAAREFDVKPKLTYESVHRLQDALHRACDRDGAPGLTASAEAVYDTSGVLVDWSMRGGDEYHLLLQRLNLSAERVYGPTSATVNHTGERVRALLAEDSTRVFVVGVYEDFGTRTSHALGPDMEPNHWVLAFWTDGAFHEIDPWREPGASGLVRWSDETAVSMLLDTRNPIYWVWRR